MKKLFAGYGSLMIRLVVIQLGSAFLGLILSFSTIGEATLFTIASVFCILFYNVIAYTVANEAGLRDETRIYGGRLEYSNTRGVFIALIVNSVNFLTGIVTIIAKAFISNVSFFGSGKGITGEPVWAASVYQVSGIISEFTQPMYLGVINTFFDGNPLVFIAMPIISTAVITVGYMLGQKGWAGLFTGQAKAKKAKKN